MDLQERPASIAALLGVKIPLMEEATIYSLTGTFPLFHQRGSLLKVKQNPNPTTNKQWTFLIGLTEKLFFGGN